MKIYLLNDTRAPRQHSGSAACMRSIEGRLLAEGHVIVERHFVNSQPRPVPPNAEALVVNGEGTMHHDRPFAVALMRMLENGQRLGRATYLVNTIYQGMSHEFDGVLRNLTGVAVRDPYSLRELRCRGANRALLRLDSSADPEILNGGRSKRRLSRVSCGKQWPSKPIQRGPGEDRLFLDEDPFEDVVATLADGCELYRTGQYHGVIAAPLAGIEFDLFPTNDTWKVPALVSWIESEGLDLKTSSGRQGLFKSRSVWLGLSEHREARRS